MSFLINKKELFYYNGNISYNNPKNNERKVELPLGDFFLKKYLDVIELGAVMPYYNYKKHVVYDLHDPYIKCERIDFTNLNISFVGKNILSISTLEHVGFNDYGKPNGRYAKEEWNKGYKVIEKIVKESNKYLITFPIGYNPVLDDLIEKNISRKIILKRINKENQWITDNSLNNMRYLYGLPQGKILENILGEKIKNNQINAKFNNANAICIITNDDELLRI